MKSHDDKLAKFKLNKFARSNTHSMGIPSADDADCKISRGLRGGSSW